MVFGEGHRIMAKVIKREVPDEDGHQFALLVSERELKVISVLAHLLNDDSDKDFNLSILCEEVKKHGFK